MNSGARTAELQHNRKLRLSSATRVISKRDDRHRVRVECESEQPPWLGKWLGAEFANAIFAGGRSDSGSWPSRRHAKWIDQSLAITS